MTYAGRRAAVQMDADGIRKIPVSQRQGSLCGQVLLEERGIIVRCHKRALYFTPHGRRCFTHARSAEFGNIGADGVQS